MGTYYKTRRATMSAAVNTPTPVNLDAEGNTAGGIQIPAECSQIQQILVALAASIVAVASSGVTIILRLTGDGLVDGQQDIEVGGLREDTTSTGGLHVTPSFPILDEPIKVKGGNTVNISYVIGGVDPGSPEIGVTLIVK